MLLDSAVAGNQTRNSRVAMHLNAIVTRLSSHPVFTLRLRSKFAKGRHEIKYFWNIHLFLPRELCQRGLGSRNSVSPSVRLSVTRVLCN